MDLNSKSFDSSTFNLGAQYIVLLGEMFGACMVHDTSVHQIFRALTCKNTSSGIMTKKLSIIPLP